MSDEIRSIVGNDASQREIDAIAMLLDYGCDDGAHHKMWAIDQTVRILAGKHYEAIIKHFCEGAAGPYTYEWDEGIPS